MQHRCAIGQTRIQTPAKGNKCRHIQCFDLDTYIEYVSKHNQSTCPLCDKDIPFGELHIDAWMLDVLKKVCMCVCVCVCVCDR